MKALRIVCIFLLVVGLVLGSVGITFAEGPPHGKGPPEGKPAANHDKGPPEGKPEANHAKGPPEGKPAANHAKGLHKPDKKRGFSGNVTEVIKFTDGIVFGNVTLLTNQKWTVVVKLTESTSYKAPRETPGWIDDFDYFVEEVLAGNLTALEGRRLAVLAGNVTGAPPGPFAGEALRLMVLPRPGTPQHAHRTGNVTEFNPPAPGVPDAIGNITIVDVQGVSHTFVVDGNTTYRPYPPETTAEQIEWGSFVTVVTTGDPKLEPPAKAIVLHIGKPED